MHAEITGLGGGPSKLGGFETTIIELVRPDDRRVVEVKSSVVKDGGQVVG
jgi:hypothetical protein